MILSGGLGGHDPDYPNLDNITMIGKSIDYIVSYRRLHELIVTHRKEEEQNCSGEVSRGP